MISRGSSNVPQLCTDAGRIDSELETLVIYTQRAGYDEACNQPTQYTHDPANDIDCEKSACQIFLSLGRHSSICEEEILLATGSHAPTLCFCSEYQLVPAWPRLFCGTMGDRENECERGSDITQEAEIRGPSPLRRLAPLLQVPEIVWLAGGLPNAAMFPIKSLSAKLTDGTEIEMELGAEDKALYTSQQYMTESQGLPSLVAWCERHTVMLHGELPQHRVMLTAGSTASADIAMRILLEKGDIVLTEEYTYPNFVASVKPLGVRVSAITMDSEGMSATALEAAITDIRAEGHMNERIVLYIGTTGQNPTGHSYSANRLHEIYAVAQKFDIIIIEDDPYLYLSFPSTAGDGDPPPPGLFGLKRRSEGHGRCCSLLSIDTDARVLRMDTFSKFIAPGLRCSWMTLPERLMKPAVYASQYSTQTGSSLSQVLLMKMLEAWGDDGLHAHLAQLQTFYHSRLQALESAAKKHLTGLATWKTPDAGMFVWIKLDGIGDSEELMDMLKAEKVAVVPGKYFMSEADPNVNEFVPCPFIRVAFTVATDADFDAAFIRLARILRKYEQK